jgi:phosphatidylglycerophosphatase A
MEETSQRYVATLAQKNVRTIDYCRSFFSAVSGSAAGILGLTNTVGFVFYAVTSLIFSLLLYTVKAHGNADKYFRQGAKEVVWDGVLGGMLSYVLFWTLLYGIVHIYD